MFWDHHAEFSEWKLAQDVIWAKPNGTNFLIDRFRRTHETAVHFFRGPWEELQLTALKIQVTETRKRKTARRSAPPPHLNTVGKQPLYVYDGERLHPSVIHADSVRGSRWSNETQKPEALVAPLVDYSAGTGGDIIDLFAGSGTALAIAKSRGLRAIGFEKRADQCEDIVTRLAEIIPLPVNQPTDT